MPQMTASSRVENAWGGTSWTARVAWAGVSSHPYWAREDTRPHAAPRLIAISTGLTTRHSSKSTKLAATGTWWLAM